MTSLKKLECLLIRKDSDALQMNQLFNVKLQKIFCKDFIGLDPDEREEQIKRQEIGIEGPSPSFCQQRTNF